MAAGFDGVIKGEDDVLTRLQRGAGLQILRQRASSHGHARPVHQVGVQQVLEHGGGAAHLARRAAWERVGRGGGRGVRKVGKRGGLGAS